MPEDHLNPSWPRPARRLLFLGLAFLAGYECTHYLRLTQPLLNYLFAAGLMSLPFVALHPLSQLPRVPRIIGRVLLSPILVFLLFLALTFVACGDLDLHPYTKQSCLQELETIEQPAYSVHLLRDGCGGATVSFMILAEQRMPLLPGLYIFRTVAFFDGAYDGRLTLVGANEVRIQIPKGVQGSGWNQEVDRVYQLKPHVYFR